MHYIRAISPSLVVHFLEIDPDNKNDKDILDRLIDKKWTIEKSEKKGTHIPIKTLYEKPIQT